MKKTWYEIVQELGIDLEPIIWFFLSASLIFLGMLFIEDEQTMVGTLFVALGGAGITRVRGSRKKAPGDTGNISPNEPP